MYISIKKTFLFKCTTHCTLFPPCIHDFPVTQAGITGGCDTQALDSSYNDKQRHHVAVQKIYASVAQALSLSLSLSLLPVLLLSNKYFQF